MDQIPGNGKVRHGRQDDHRHLIPLFTNPADQLGTVYLRHADIRNDDIRNPFLQKLQRLPAIFSGQNIRNLGLVAEDGILHAIQNIPLILHQH